MIIVASSMLWVNRTPFLRCGNWWSVVCNYRRISCWSQVVRCMRQGEHLTPYHGKCSQMMMIAALLLMIKDQHNHLAKSTTMHIDMFRFHLPSTNLRSFPGQDKIIFPNFKNRTWQFHLIICISRASHIWRCAPYEANPYHITFVPIFYATVHCSASVSIVGSHFPVTSVFLWYLVDPKYSCVLMDIFPGSC